MVKLGANKISSSYLLFPKQAGNHKNKPKEKLEKVKNFLKDIGKEKLEKVKNVFKDIDLEDYEHLKGIVNSYKGVFTQFKKMGITAAYFCNSEQEKRAKLELENDYSFIPDFPLSIPDMSRKILSEEQSSTSPQLSWPPESGIKKAHAMGNKGAGVIIGVLDSGIDSDHQEFTEKKIKFRCFSTIRNSIAPYRDVRGFDINGHGTQVCGVIAGKNIGIAPEAELYVGAVIGNGIESSLFRVVAGLEWLLEEFRKPENEGKPKIINMSITFRESDLKDVLKTPIQVETALNDLRGTIARLIEEEDILLVASIGNGDTGKVTYPGAFEEVLGVGAVNFNKEIWENSESDETVSKPNVVGYGVDIHSCVERDYDGNSLYQKNSGTSIASAYVTGVAALYWSHNMHLKAEEVKEKISVNTDTSRIPLDKRFGRGLVVYKPDS